VPRGGIGEHIVRHIALQQALMKRMRLERVPEAQLKQNDSKAAQAQTVRVLLLRQRHHCFAVSGAAGRERGGVRPARRRSSGRRDFSCDRVHVE
jgi:hypothetical protein